MTQLYQDRESAPSYSTHIAIEINCSTVTSNIVEIEFARLAASG
ncbi:hypothetical protein AGRO_1518 [Agrobacterium sp. ATCC 31749]|nr:hypothetical protein AGRO_1518 [Agrobacterium sp. ATCC 31749]